MTTAHADTLRLGVCDYPEHVDQSDWQMHAKKQRELGLSWVRLAEFSWAKLEPTPGKLQFEWLDEAIAIYAEQGLSVVLGTPTATPPAWLVAQHPEMLAVDENNQIKKFGSRRHYDHGCETYRQHCARIVSAMANRYASHPAVKGWQIDNELGHEGTAVSYGGATERRFAAWLEDKYQTLEALNQAWGNAFWSQDYSDWQQISAPNLTAVRQANPAHSLDYQRFCSHLVEEFQQLQIDILRRICPSHFITHNFVIFSAELDLYRLASPLDFVSWDSYPIGMLEFFATWESEQVKTEYARTGHPDLVSLNHDIYRGLLAQTPFWVMEQQCGHANWAAYNPLPADGAVSLWTAQAWAHGASGVIYFRFRASHFAQEIMHSGLLQQNGQPDRGYAQVEQLKDCHFPAFQNANRVAVVHDYPSLWSYNQQPHNQDLSYWHQFTLFYSALRGLGIDVDIVHSSQLQQGNYALIVCPALTLLSPESAQHLLDASNRSQLIFGPRCDFRDQYGKAAKCGQFSQLASLIGARLGNFDSLRPTLSQGIRSRQHDDNCVYTAKLWCESYHTESASAEYVYSGGPLDGQPAVVKQQQCRVIGALSPPLIEKVITDVCASLDIATFSLPPGVRLSRCGEQYLISNFNSQKVNWQGLELAPVSYQLVTQLPVI